MHPVSNVAVRLQEDEEDYDDEDDLDEDGEEDEEDDEEEDDVETWQVSCAHTRLNRARPLDFGRGCSYTGDVFQLSDRNPA